MIEWVTMALFAVLSGVLVGVQWERSRQRGWLKRSVDSLVEESRRLEVQSQLKVIDAEKRCSERVMTVVQAMQEWNQSNENRMLNCAHNYWMDAARSEEMVRMNGHQYSVHMISNDS